MMGLYDKYILPKCLNFAMKAPAMANAPGSATDKTPVKGTEAAVTTPKWKPMKTLLTGLLTILILNVSEIFSALTETLTVPVFLASKVLKASTLPFLSSDDDIDNSTSSLSLFDTSIILNFNQKNETLLVLYFKNKLNF